MSRGSTPGNDGIPVDFYLHLWETVGPMLVDSLNYGFDQGKLSTSQRQSIITLIEKKGRTNNTSKTGAQSP